MNTITQVFLPLLFIIPQMVGHGQTVGTVQDGTSIGGKSLNKIGDYILESSRNHKRPTTSDKWE